jgi:trans-aconitate 2-methyltransferase
MTEWNAAEYARRSGLQAAMAAEVLALVAFDGGERVLDIGCGDGKITAAIAQQVPRGSVVGVDPSHDMIAFAAAHFTTAACPNLRFQVADARALPYRDDFDRVVSFNALHWVPDQDGALRSIRRAMTEAGRAQLRLVPDGARASLETVVEATRRERRWEAAFADFHDPYLHLTPAQYAAAAERNGLRVTLLRVHDKAWDFGSRAAFHAFSAVGLVAWTQRLPEAERTAFVDDVLDRYRRATATGPAEDGLFRFYQMDVTLARAPGAPT